MSDVAETLDPLRLPLQGERLIEALPAQAKPLRLQRSICACYLG